MPARMFLAVLRQALLQPAQCAGRTHALKVVRSPVLRSRPQGCVLWFTGLSGSGARRGTSRPAVPPADFVIHPRPMFSSHHFPSPPRPHPRQVNGGVHARARPPQRREAVLRPRRRAASPHPAPPLPALAVAPPPLRSEQAGLPAGRLRPPPGDNIRHGLNKNLGFSADDRKENIRRIGAPRTPSLARPPAGATPAGRPPPPHRART